MLGLGSRSNIIYKLGSVLLWNVFFFKAFRQIVLQGCLFGVFNFVFF